MAFWFKWKKLLWLNTKSGGIITQKHLRESNTQIMGLTLAGGLKEKSNESIHF
jgi:hypothetical protein